jgi:hypothetical protein
MGPNNYLAVFFAALTVINTVLILLLNSKKVYDFLIKPRFSIRPLFFVYQAFFEFHIVISNEGRWRFRPRATRCEGHVTIRDAVVGGNVLSDHPLIWEEYESRQVTIPSGSSRVLRFISVSNDEKRQIIVRGKDVNGQRHGSTIPFGLYDILFELTCEEETCLQELLGVAIPKDVVEKAAIPVSRT